MIKAFNPLDPYSFMPKAISEVALEVDHVFAFIYWICLFFFVLIMVLMCIFVVRYIRKDPTKKTPHQSHSTLLELSWSVPPIILIVFMFMWGFEVYMKMRVPENDAEVIYVTASKWNWAFNYPKTGQTVSGEFAVPLNKPVKLIMTSQDVIHSFYVRELRQKQDVLPNQYTTLPFHVIEGGEYMVQCTEYCGDSHWNMRAVMHVLPEAEYQEWTLTGGIDESQMSPVQLGEIMFKRAGCLTCHAPEGNGSCPSFVDQWGTERQVMLPGGGVETVVLDENYFLESINEPNAKLRVPYTAQMSSYAGQFTDSQIRGIIEYLKQWKSSE